MKRHRRIFRRTWLAAHYPRILQIADAHARTDKQTDYEGRDQSIIDHFAVREGLFFAGCAKTLYFGATDEGDIRCTSYAP